MSYPIYMMCFGIVLSAVLMCFGMCCMLDNWKNRFSFLCSAGKERALVISNHRSDIDWLVGWIIAQVCFFASNLSQKSLVKVLSWYSITWNTSAVLVLLMLKKGVFYGGAEIGVFRWDSSCHEEVYQISSGNWLVYVVLGVCVFVKKLDQRRESFEGIDSSREFN